MVGNLSLEKMCKSYRTCLVAHHDKLHHYIRLDHFACLDSSYSSIDHNMAHSNAVVPMKIDVGDAAAQNYGLDDSNFLCLCLDTSHDHG